MRRLLVALFAVALVAGGCNAEQAVPRHSVDVDTPQLRQAKQAAGIADCVRPSGAAADQGLPDVSLPCLGGGPAVGLARLRGPMVVNLFAQWCKPCRDELPIYQRFHDKYAGRVSVLGIDWQDTQPAAALQLAADSGVTYPLLADPDPRLHLRGLPQLVLLDKDGAVAYKEYVEIKSLAQLEDLVSEHLGVHP